MSAADDSYSTEAYEKQLEGDIAQLQLGDRPSTDATRSSPAAAASADASTAAADSASASAEPAPTGSNDSAASADRVDGEIDTSRPGQTVERSLSYAIECKQRGNEAYARQQYDAAIAAYTEAIECCPSGDAATEADREHLSVFYSNRAAAYLMLKQYEQTVSDCTASLELHPQSAKPLSRRAKAYEALEQYAEAVEDYKALVQLDPRDRDSAAALQRVEKLHAEKTEKMKAEMLGKLKDLGNTVLGKFGLSLDNFKAVKDPNTGSYNISFGK